MVTTATSSHVEENTNSNLHTISGKMIDGARAGKSVAVERKHEWGVILAGGDGTRLKSLTRRIIDDERPKQFCPVFGDMTLLEETQRRVALELAKERTLFVVNRVHEPYYSAVLGDTPASNLIEQPRNIGTAPAILYSLMKIAAADSQAIIAFFPSDHYISDNTKFMAHIRSAFETAHVGQDLVILLGIEPKPRNRIRLDPTCASDSRTQTVAPSQAFLGKALFRFGCHSAATRLSLEQFRYDRVRPHVNRYYRERHTSAI